MQLTGRNSRCKLFSEFLLSLLFGHFLILPTKNIAALINVLIRHLRKIIEQFKVIKAFKGGMNVMEGKAADGNNLE